MPDDGRGVKISAGKGKGIYLFCFARPHVPPVVNVSGIGDRYLVLQWTFEDILAVLTKVSLEEFCGPLAESRMQNLSWIGPRACRHEEVIEHVMRHSPVLPARFGTIFSSPESLEGLVKMHHDAISRFLDQVTDKEEWAVKGLMDRAKAKEELLSVILAREGGALASLSPGVRYFQEQRIRAGAEKELNLWLKEICKRVANDLSRSATDFRERKVLSREATGMDGDMVLNWAFLVPRSVAADFRKRIEQANSDHAQQGLAFHLSGPWPPYSFCPPLKIE
jgi:hypothetical protein